MAKNATTFYDIFFLNRFTIKDLSDNIFDPTPVTLACAKLPAAGVYAYVLWPPLLSPSSSTMLGLCGKRSDQLPEFFHRLSG